MISLCLALAFRQQSLTLNPLFSDNMVLQQHAQDPVFGTADPGSAVLLTIGTRSYTTRADELGQWKILLPPLEPGPAISIQVSSGAEQVNIGNVKVGEVWLAAGQSNMEFQEQQADDFEEAKTQTDPDVRMFTVRKATAETPVQKLQGSWECSAPDNIGHFSAVGLAFAREISRRLQVPVGIINSSWGGTPAEAWISREAIQRDPAVRPIFDKYLSDLKVFPARHSAYEVAMQMWINGHSGRDNQGFQNNWTLGVLDDSDWQTVQAGTDTRTILKRDFLGSVWYRKTVVTPDEWYGQPLRLSLGQLNEYDSTYFNGVRVGLTDQRVQDPGQVFRQYLISPGLVHKGKNLIAVRVFNSEGSGGMQGPAEQMRLALLDETASIPLNGEWKFKVEQELDPDAPRPHLPNGPGNPTSPSELFNAMVAPLIPFGIKGVIWYQGESNVGQSERYEHLFPDLIRDWRARWGEGLFPFYYVQLPNYGASQREPGESAWANLREAQEKALSVPHTGMAVTMDLGNPNDIHPTNKREVGRRLSLWALQLTYNQPTAYGSPMMRSMMVRGDTAEVTFRNGSLTTTDHLAPSGFAMAGPDHRFYWAKARLDGSTVTLTCPQVPHPLAVRYAWADNPDVNLVNMVGLPAAPFRTDDWKLKEQ